MIHQDRFLRLLAAVDALQEMVNGYRTYLDSLQAAVNSGQLHAERVHWVLAAWLPTRPRSLPDHLMQAIADERAHFRANAKRNEKTRRYRALKQDLKRHNDHKATVTPWAGMANTPEPQLIPIQDITPLTRERLEQLQAEAAAMPPPAPGVYEQAIAEARRKVEELTKKHNLPKAHVFSDDEILGDTDGTEDPFADTHPQA